VIGGHCAYNPEPVAAFVDLVVLGDGEETVGDITRIVSDWKASGRGDREEVLRALCAVPGVYVPAGYEAHYDGQDLVAVEPIWPEAPEVVEKRSIADLADWPYPRSQLVPLTEVVHDRLNVEVFRGCTRGCRFCQAGMVTRPVRERPAEQVRSMVAGGLRRTGYDEVALTSLSTADFSGIGDVVGGIIDDEACGRVSVSLPSLRVDAFGVDIASQLQRGRRTGLTFAPEAGTWRMRQVINKLIREQDLYDAVESAYSQGWRRMKLYFLTGLPTETDEDTLGIAELAANCVEIGKRHHKGPSVTVSLGGFVPKAHTPFQWEAQASMEELRERGRLVKSLLSRERAVKLSYHEPAQTFLEGVFSRGDRRLGPVLEEAWHLGARFDGWTETFNLDNWLEAFHRCGVDPGAYTAARRVDEPLPWSHIDPGVSIQFLRMERERALGGARTRDCREGGCNLCGFHLRSCPMIESARGGEGHGG